jgi:hypothetical protein
LQALGQCFGEDERDQDQDADEDELDDERDRGRHAPLAFNLVAGFQ